MSMSNKTAMGFCLALWSAFAIAAYQGLPFLNGGIGEDERAQMSAQENDFTLKLIFAAKAGAYIATTDTVVLDDKGQQIFALKSAGPFLLLQLAPGRYLVRATFDGTVSEQKVAIASGTRSELMFRW